MPEAPASRPHPPRLRGARRPPPRSPVRAAPGPALALALTVALVLAATLHPSSYEGAQGWDGCVLCGTRGLADAVLNVGLFAPLGAALAWVGVGWRRALVLAALLSAGVEAAQLLVPGRDPSPPDLAFNALGTVAGFAAARWATPLLRAGPGAGTALATGWALLFAASVAASAWLTAPSLERARVFAQWNADVGDRPPYAGPLLSASVGPLPLGPGPSPAPADVRRALAGGAPLQVRFVAAAPPRGRPATLLRLAGAGDVGLVLLSAHGDDLLFGYRTRAADLRLDAPVHRIPGALRGVVPGREVEVAVAREGRRVRARVDGRAAAAPDPAAARGWSLLWSGDELSARAVRLLDALWVALWALPLGLWRRHHALAPLPPFLAGAALTALPALLGLGMVAPEHGLGAAAGYGVGMAMGRMLRGG